MGKFENLERWIEKCNEFVSTFNPDYDTEEGQRLLELIYAIYDSEITDFQTGLESFEHVITNREPKNHIESDLKTVKRKLLNYKEQLKKEEREIQEKRETARCQAENNKISVTANAENFNEIQMDINIDFKQVIEKISHLPEQVISEADKKQLEDKLSEVEKATEDQKSRKQKLMNILKFLGDKSADAVIAVLPYLAGKI